MIPKLIHQTAKTRDLPERVRGFQQKLIALHPGWTYHLWTDEDNDAFVKKEYPEFYNIFAKLPRNIMRADVIRYLLMYKLGGFYLDTDYEMLKPFDLTAHDIVLAWESHGQFGVGKDLICNSIFASAPGQVFFKRVIDDLTASPPLAENLNVEASTGPIFLTRVYNAAVKDGLDLYTAHYSLFSPPMPWNTRQFQAIVNDGVAYGVHHCHGTWREFSAAKRLKIAVGRFVRRFS